MNSWSSNHDHRSECPELRTGFRGQLEKSKMEETSFVEKL